ncbi:MAG: diacylglycerol kinase family lipid kinase [Gemmatimonadetes bacterium]|nr:diacylglycerol kinase family lipid kinase [Gemmatimonadota bacterium]
MAKHWVLIANPTAGNARARSVAEQAALAIQAAGQAVELRYTRAKGHATELAQQAVAEGAERLVVCGGDGTIGETLAPLAGSRTALALLPCGTCNDLARALDVPLRVEAAIDNLLCGEVRAIDLGRAGDRFFATIAAFGFDAEVNRRMESAQGPLSGRPRYIWEALRHVVRYQPPRVRLCGDFGEIEQEVLQVSTANARNYGGDLRVAPDADLGDGLFDVVVVDAVPRRAILSLMLRLFWQAHVRHPAVRVERTARLALHTDAPHRVYADGDYLDQTPLVLEISPAALRVVVPSSCSQGVRC